MQLGTVGCIALGYVMLSLSAARAADPWADKVIEYIPGTGVPAVFGSDPPILFNQPTAALGEPTRDSVAFGGFTVSPYSSPGDPSEVVSLGAGGSLTLSFDEPVTDDPQNPYGIDLLIFGNAFFTTSDFNFDGGTTNAGVASDGGIVEISDDGLTFVEVTGLAADSLFPTNGYADTTDFFPAGPGSVPADFTLPVDPSFDPLGLGMADTIAGYRQSGGGAGIDISQWGFSTISYVRFSNPLNSITTPEIDAVADVRPVPEASTLLWSLLGVAGLAMRRFVG